MRFCRLFYEVLPECPGSKAQGTGLVHQRNSENSLQNLMFNLFGRVVCYVSFPFASLMKDILFCGREWGVCDSDDGKVSFGFRGIFDNLVQKLKNKDLLHNLLTIAHNWHQEFH